MDRRRIKTNDSTHFHQKRANSNDFKTNEGKEKAQREVDDKRSYGGLIDKLHSLDITLSRNLSFCADKSSGRWRKLMIIMEISGHGVPWLAGTIISILMFSDLKQEFACNLLSALMLDLAVVGACKVAVRRKRPVYNEMDMFATVSVDNYSFPSGHSTRAAMVAGLFAAFLSNGICRILIGCWALCVSASRVILGRHHVSDVFCGVVIGLLQALIVYTIWIPNSTCQELLTLVPYFGELRNQVAFLER
ncbi:polyisoprenoid diphosphate/phosphate phosphohydrolase PLPP6-like [Oculina patagonica]